jgi:hypothetical protein
LRKIVSEEQDQSQPGQQAPGKEIASAGAQEQVLHSHTSYWPLALAVALVVILIGIISNSAVILAIGAVMAVAAVIGWGLEHH